MHFIYDIRIHYYEYPQQFPFITNTLVKVALAVACVVLLLNSDAEIDMNVVIC